MVVDMSAKEKVKELRIKHGMTQAQLGQILGVGQKSVSMIENGTNNLTLPQLELLSRYFNVSADYLLFGTQEASNIVEKEILNVVRSDKGIFDAMVNLVNSRRNVQQLAV